MVPWMKPVPPTTTTISVNSSSASPIDGKAPRIGVPMMPAKPARAAPNRKTSVLTTP